MRNPFQLALSALCLTLIACSGDDHDHPNPEAGNLEMRASAYETPAEFREHLENALRGYFDLKDALVESDAQKSASYARIFNEKLEKVPAGDLSAEARALWVISREVLIGESNLIADLSDIEDQRIAFDPLSIALIQSIEAFGPLENAVFQKTCPMVGEGSADWLSASEDVKNPYHGDRMLNCGTVVRMY